MYRSVQCTVVIYRNRSDAGLRNTIKKTIKNKVIIPRCNEYFGCFFPKIRSYIKVFDITNPRHNEQFSPGP